MNKLLMLILCGLLAGIPALSSAQDLFSVSTLPDNENQEEIRSLWVLPWDINSPSKVAKLVETAINSHQNELLVEVRYRSDALFDTDRGAAQFPNPEPRSHTLEIPDYDPLMDILELAHAAGIKVHAWVIAFNATPLDPALLENNYIYKNHPEWITHDNKHRIMTGNSQFGYYIDPGIPEVQDYLLNIIGNLVTGYPDLDGIQLDYIRYPNSSLGYHPVSLALYESYCLENGEISFNDWRIMQVSGFVYRFHELVKSISPDMITSAAVFADIAEANVQYAQDWTKWLQNGYIDRVYPMAYSTSIKTFSNQLKQYQLLGRNEDIVVGMRAWRDDGTSILSTSGYNLADISQRIEQIRAQEFAGIALFSYSGIKPYGAWKMLTEMSYPKILPISKVPSLHKPGILFVPTATAEGYNLELIVPEDGMWHWMILGQNVKYQHLGIYQKGSNRDFWDGISFAEQGEETSRIEPGDYLVQMFQDGSSYQYVIPVTFKALVTP